MKTAIIIGRFQVPYLHLGHIYLISHALLNYNRVVILLGCQHYMDERNPYSIEHRKSIINKIFPQVEIEPLWDDESNEMWSIKVDEISLQWYNPVLLHSRDSFIKSYTGILPSDEVSELEGYSGTNERNK